MAIIDTLTKEQFDIFGVLTKRPSYSGSCFVNYGMDHTNSQMQMVWSNSSDGIIPRMCPDRGHVLVKDKQVPSFIASWRDI